MINYRLKIDFCDSKILASDICFVSGDIKSSTLYFEFYNKGKKVDISGYTLSVRAKRSDGVVVASSGKIYENTAVFTPESNMYCIPGELYIEIALADSSGRYATTKIITADVIEGLGEAAIEGVDDLNIYVQLLSDAVSAKEEAITAAEIAKNVHPEIRDGIWWVYDTERGEMMSSGVKAEGDVPIRGVDYWNEEDVSEIRSYAKEMVDESVGDIISALDSIITLQESYIGGAEE